MRTFVEHIGIVVRSLAESVPFYEALLGAPPIQRVSWRGKDAEYVAEMVAHPGLELDAAFFRLPTTRTLLEMIEYSNVPAAGVKLDPMQVSAMHIGIFVDDIDAAIERLRGFGVKFRSAPVDIPYGPYKGGRTIYFNDPNGVNVQLMQVVGRPGGIGLPVEVERA